MTILAVDETTGREEKAEHIYLTNHLVKVRNENMSDPWKVVEEVVTVWRKREPQKWDSYIVHLQDVKEAQKKTRVGGSTFRGVSHDKQNDAYMSLLVDVPQWIVLALRKLYTTDELDMDKEFFRKFGRRFPLFQVREKA